MEEKQGSKLKEIAPYVLASIVVIGFFALLYILMFEEIPQNNKDVLNIVVGALIGAFTAVVGFFFGSSVGSKEKTKMLNTKN